MTDINNLLDIQSHEVLWDYCLECNIITPSYRPYRWWSSDEFLSLGGGQLSIRTNLITRLSRSGNRHNLGRGTVMSLSGYLGHVSSRGSHRHRDR